MTKRGSFTENASKEGCKMKRRYTALWLMLWLLLGLVAGCGNQEEAQGGQQANQILLIHTTHASSVTVTVPNTGSTVSLAARSAAGAVI